MPKDGFMDLSQKLSTLYSDDTKHSNYQNVPEFVREQLGYSETIDEEWRGDTARYGYIQESLEFKTGMIIGDIGANTGFFTLSLGHLYKDLTFIAYEANPNHVEFMELIIKEFGLRNILIKKFIVDLDNIEQLQAHNILLFLNVLHHAGYDFDNHIISNKVEEFEKYALEYLLRLKEKTEKIVFQMGSNWGGDKLNPIIDREDDYGKIIYISNLFIKTGWKIEDIALATRDETNTIIYKKIPYNLVDELNVKDKDQKLYELSACIERYDLDHFVGEFYRRPIFICNSRI